MLELDSNSGFKRETGKETYVSASCSYSLYIADLYYFTLHCYCLYFHCSTTALLCYKNCVLVSKAYSIMLPHFPLLYS